MTGPKRRLLAGSMLVMLVTSSAAAALAAPIAVETNAIGGTRTLTLTALSGTSLNTISLGASGSASFFTDVADFKYSRAGYQVTASLSNLYAYDGAVYNCSTQIASSNLSLDFLADPISVTDIAALPDPSWDLSGTLPAPLAALLGVADGTPVTVPNVPGERIDRLLAGILDGTEDSLPVKIAVGTSGAFTDPGPHTDCDAAPPASTVRSLQDGTTSDLAGLFTWVTTEITSAADDDTNGTVTGAELVTTGEVADAQMATDVRTALAAAGIDLGLLDTLLAAGTLTMDQIYAILVGTLDALASLVGQSGTYLSVPRLNVAVPGGTPSGTYRGTLTVTLVDV